MASHAALFDLIDLFYTAALHPEHWDDALARLAQRCGGRAAGLRIEGACFTQRWVGLEPSFNAAYVEHYWREDPWVLAAQGTSSRFVGHGEKIVSRRDLEKSAFYNDLSRPYGLDDLVGGVLTREPGKLVSVGVMGERGVRFGDEQSQVIERLLPHLTRAIHIGERLLGSPFGDLRPTLDERLRCTYGLSRAEARIAILIAHGRAPKEAASMLGTSWNTVRTHLSRVFLKTRTRKQSELASLIARIEILPHAPTPAQVLSTQNVEHELQRQYGLTSAEASVAVQVGRGASPKEVAGRMHKSLNTVRFQLRRTFAKTRTSGQTELALLITRLSHPLGRA